MLVEGTYDGVLPGAPKGLFAAPQCHARCLAPWLLWTGSLFADLGHYPPPRRGRLGFDFGGMLTYGHNFARLLVVRRNLGFIELFWFHASFFTSWVDVAVLSTHRSVAVSRRRCEWRAAGDRSQQQPSAQAVPGKLRKMINRQLCSWLQGTTHLILTMHKL
jgi:hypothetical protein